MCGSEPGMVTPERVREADRLFGIAGFINSRRVEVGIGQAIVDRVHAGGAGITEPCDLNGRRPLGKDEQAVLERYGD
jgi:hypothetical protein